MSEGHDGAASPQERPTVAVLGGGSMGETVLRSMLRAGWPVERLLVTVRRSGRGHELAERYGVQVTEDNTRAARSADVLLVAVKPHDVGALLANVGDCLRPDALVVTVAAGLTAAFYEKRLPPRSPVVRVMPNTPAAVGLGATAVSAGAHATEEHLVVVEEMLSATGLVVRVAEKDQDAVSAISGSGPAYVFYVIDAMAEAGVLLGLTRDRARELAVATVLGSATLLQQTGEHPAVLREQVSSPGGTTVVALRELDDRGVRAAFIAAADAARSRSRQIAAELDHD